MRQGPIFCRNPNKTTFWATCFVQLAMNVNKFLDTLTIEKGCAPMIFPFEAIFGILAEAAFKMLGK